MTPTLAIVTVPFLQSNGAAALADTTIRSIRTRHPIVRIAMVNRFRPESKDRLWLNSNFDIIEYRDQNNLAAAWNAGIKAGLESGAELLLIINLDIILHPQAIDNLVDFARTTPEELIWSGKEYQSETEFRSAAISPSSQPGIHYSCFLLGRELLDLVGFFDEQFEPAYFEDADMTRRLALRGKHGLITASAPFFHYHMGTFKTSVEREEQLDELGRQIEWIVTSNQERYIKKWGGPPMNERFEVPYKKI